ncbi:MAG TPA: hypothetical protein VFV70_16200, partial [Hyphomonadaceae bacterium]|nr:hypothetical protein [Hyphomonadaceae bacterium]
MDEALGATAQEAVERPSPAIEWLARVLCWFCWLGIALSLWGAAVGLFNLSGPGIDRTENGFQNFSTLINFDARLNDGAAHTQALVGLHQDILYRIGGLVPIALYVWALLSARRSFIGVGRGEYFARPTVLGLRNLALAVLLYHTLAPILEIIPRVLYFMRIKGEQTAELSFAMGINEPVMLMLVFAGAVTLVSSVMAHAAKIAEENRQFI